ncbi:hypothetical protein J7382_16180 [Shimia sp. R11_0]|uniref:hypothetical protein n=1 Tax=Shimia sp. R11_0 TaxID=2821096 RepID=UPI001ADBC83C|nr:hypothetical protein [Shimia sp. R11_0]MBO9479087.1 hypothetical protein [Shimia sp. R11_0]
MPKLIALYIRQVAIGFAISAAFVAMLLYLNVANLWHLVSSSSDGVLAVVVMWVLNGIVFAGVQFGIAIMRMKDDDHPGGGKRDALPTGLQQVMLAEPVPVKIDQRSPQKKQLQR